MQVSEISDLIRNNILTEFNKTINVEGEVSNLKVSRGHLFMSLKDSKSLLNVTFWNYNNEPDFENGDQILVTGKITTFVRNSSYQLTAYEIEKCGEGETYKNFIKMKEHYENLGYFDQKNKKELPHNLKNIAIITAINSDALQDIKSVLKKHNFNGIINIQNSTVQGINCPREVSNAITKLDKLNFDCIILARGGGSTEDLMGFSSEQVIESIYNCNTCVISAIGHENDYMISDFVADIRAGTPSIAGELITSFQKQKIDEFNKVKHYLEDNIKVILKNKINEHENMIIKIKNKLNETYTSIDDFKTSNIKLLEQLKYKIKDKLEELNQETNRILINLESNNYKLFLEKGFCYILNSDHNNIKKDDILEIKTANKILKVKVLCE